MYILDKECYDGALSLKQKECVAMTMPPSSLFPKLCIGNFSAPVCLGVEIGAMMNKSKSIPVVALISYFVRRHSVVDISSWLPQNPLVPFHQFVPSNWWMLKSREQQFHIANFQNHIFFNDLFVYVCFNVLFICVCFNVLFVCVYFNDLFVCVCFNYLIVCMCFNYLIVCMSRNACWQCLCWC